MPPALLERMSKLDVTFAPLSSAELATANGSHEVGAVLRVLQRGRPPPGAGTRAQQRARTDAWNAERGCPTWADLQARRK